MQPEGPQVLLDGWHLSDEITEATAFLPLRPMRIFSVPEAQSGILRRQPYQDVTLPPALQEPYGRPVTAVEATHEILEDVAARGDAALMDWSSKLEGGIPRALEIGAEDLRKAYEGVPAALAASLKLAADRIRAFHQKQPCVSWIDTSAQGTLGQVMRPIDRVGIYCPGGTAPLPSTLLMTVIPAQVAGVPSIAAITPAQRETGLPSEVTLAAAHVAGLQSVYVAGGAQAIGALAFGTETVKKVDKICGPGGLFTTLAKKELFGQVGIDGLAGPTETLIIADETADAGTVAADLLAQAEHDILASAILLTPVPKTAEAVAAAMGHKMETLPRAEIVAQSMAQNGGIVVTDTLTEAFHLSNLYAPEHLCLMVQDPWSHLPKVRNAGGIFLGRDSFEVLGDYVAGPSHVMPTNGTARFSSALNVLDFVRIVSVFGLNQSALDTLGPAAARLATAEGLDAHARTVTERLDSC